MKINIKINLVLDCTNIVSIEIEQRKKQINFNNYIVFIIHFVKTYFKIKKKKTIIRKTRIFFEKKFSIIKLT